MRHCVISTKVYTLNDSGTRAKMAEAPEHRLSVAAAGETHSWVPVLAL